MPADAVILAACDGEVWSTVETERGIGVVIGHGRGAIVATYHQHLASCKFGIGIKRGAGAFKVYPSIMHVITTRYP